MREFEIDEHEEFEFGPTGYGIKVRMDPVKEKVGSLFMPENRLEHLRHTQQYGYVVEMGPDCYKHPKYNGIAWCKVGDRVLIPPDKSCLFYSEKGVDYKCVNDDDIRMVGRKVHKQTEEKESV